LDLKTGLNCTDHYSLQKIETMKLKLFFFYCLFWISTIGFSQTNPLPGFSSTAGYINKLEVIATTNIDRFIRFRYGGSVPQGFAGIQYSMGDTYSWFNYSDGGGNLLFSYKSGNPVIKGDLGSPMFVMTRFGNIGIGLINPTNKLEVNGTIKTKEVNVTMTGWPDYVFDPGYEIMGLGELAEFVKENRHLPEVPSEREILEKGLNLGEMNSLLLKKIEELTLHLIEKDKEIQTLKTLEERIIILEKNMYKY
jgi:hypothetical protein